MSSQTTKETKPTCGFTAKLCCINTDSFDTHIIAKDFYKDIANDVESCSFVEII